MSVDRSQQLQALLRIITLVRSGPWTPEALARELDVSKRTFHRYLGALVDSGVPIEFDHGRKRYTIDDGYFLPPVQLTVTEGLALAALCEQIAGTEQIPGLRDAVNALHKMRATLPPALRDSIDRDQRSIAIRTGPASAPGGPEDLLENIRFALSDGTALSCRYESNRANDAESTFTLEPYALCFSRRAWYVIGRRSDRSSLRTMRVNRFVRADPTENPYVIPADFSLEQYLGNAWELIRGDDVDVELHFTDPRFASTAMETRWHATQSFEIHPDRTCTVRFTVAGLDEIEWWVLGWGEHCTVKHPAELRERVLDHARRTCMLYASGSTPADG